MFIVLFVSIMFYRLMFNQDWAQGVAFMLLIGIVPITNIPTLVIAILVLLYFRRTLRQHLRYWYFGFPIVAAAIMMLGRPLLWEEVGLTALCSTVSSFLFYYWNVKSPVPD